MANFSTHASDAIWWPNLELMQVEPSLAGEITQVRDALPWVRVPLAMFIKQARKLQDAQAKKLTSSQANKLTS